MVEQMQMHGTGEGEIFLCISRENTVEVRCAYFVRARNTHGEHDELERAGVVGRGGGECDVSKMRFETVAR
jgi:hypothetical protein